jgi:hypothetical protein
VAAVQKKMEDLGLKIIAIDLKKYIPQSASNKGKKSANKKSNSEDSDSSEYLLDSDDQGGSDDDDTESDDLPQPLAIHKLVFPKTITSVSHELLCM